MMIKKIILLSLISVLFSFLVVEAQKDRDKDEEKRLFLEAIESQTTTEYDPREDIAKAIGLIEDKIASQVSLLEELKKEISDARKDNSLSILQFNRILDENGLAIKKLSREVRDLNLEAKLLFGVLEYLDNIARFIDRPRDEIFNHSLKVAVELDDLLLKEKEIKRELSLFDTLSARIRNQKEYQSLKDDLTGVTLNIVSAQKQEKALKKLLDGSKKIDFSEEAIFVVKTTIDNPERYTFFLNYLHDTKAGGLKKFIEDLGLEKGQEEITRLFRDIGINPKSVFGSTTVRPSDKPRQVGEEIKFRPKGKRDKLPPPRIRRI